MRRWDSEAPIAMLVDDPVGAGGRFGEREAVVLDYGRGPNGKEGFQLWRREKRAAFVGFKAVFDA